MDCTEVQEAANGLFSWFLVVQCHTVRRRAAKANLSGSELSERLEFIAELDAELRKRKK